MIIGELVWLRTGPELPTWGLVVDRLVVHLDSDAMMVSYEVLANSVVYQVDSSDLLQFRYYNAHLYDTMDP